jgi:hypothetical protein
MNQKLCKDIFDIVYSFLALREIGHLSSVNKFFYTNRHVFIQIQEYKGKESKLWYINASKKWGQCYSLMVDLHFPNNTLYNTEVSKLYPKLMAIYHITTFSKKMFSQLDICTNYTAIKSAQQKKKLWVLMKLLYNILYKKKEVSKQNLFYFLISIEPLLKLLFHPTPTHMPYLLWTYVFILRIYNACGINKKRLFQYILNNIKNPTHPQKLPLWSVRGRTQIWNIIQKLEKKS